jgi:cbb3-type cytochrome oxidase subunit 1
MATTRLTGTAARPAAVATPEIHQDTTVKWFLLGAVGYFFIVGIIALIIAAKFVWPQFLGSIPYFTYGRMRPCTSTECCSAGCWPRTWGWPTTSSRASAA